MKMKTSILVVEDNPDDQELLRKMLEKAGLADDVVLAASGAEALASLAPQETNPRRLLAIFLDLQLPDMTGIELLEKIRGDDRLRYLPVAVMTSSNSPENLARCKKLDVTCYVPKPITLSSFSGAIANTFHAMDDTGTLPRNFKG